MKTNGDIIISKIQELTSKGMYKEAYQYVLLNECDDAKYCDTLQCFKFLLACIIEKENLGPTKFNWNLGKHMSYQPGIDFTNILEDVNCKNNMFKELKELCKNNNPKLNK